MSDVHGYSGTVSPTVPTGLYRATCLCGWVSNGVMRDGLTNAFQTHLGNVATLRANRLREAADRMSADIAPGVPMPDEDIAAANLLRAVADDQHAHANRVIHNAAHAVADVILGVTA